MYKIHVVILCLLLTAIVNKSLAQKTESLSPFPKNAWGVYTWVAKNATDITPKDYPEVKGIPLVIGWKVLEPKNGVYAFDEVIGKALRHIAKYNYYTFLKVYYAPDAFTPEWIYESGGAPKVAFPPRINPFRKVLVSNFPYYFDSNYVKLYYRFIGEFARYVKSLPKQLQDRILFIQATEGSTGDAQGYKVEPLDPKYKYTTEQWEQFRIAAWKEYIRAFSDKKGQLIKPIVVNESANYQYENKWLIDSMPGNMVGLKMGTFSHGYDLSETQSRLKIYQDFKSDLAEKGKMLFSRGEYDAEWNVVGWSTLNPEQAIYWSSLYALYCGLDMWNISLDAAGGERFAPAFKMFNKYAGQHDGATAPGAFCALRQGLDASNTKLFPEEIFGKANRKDTSRYINIAKAFAGHGAMQGDAQKATGGYMANRQADRYNDVGWEVTNGNYEVLLRQIDADETSVGWWHIGPAKSIYGRFARGFDNAHSKTEMYFALNDQFFKEKDKLQKVSVRIIYLDRGKGKWSLYFNQSNKEQAAYTVECKNTGEWIEKTVTINALFNCKLSRNADLILKYEGGDDTVFHIIEVNRVS